MVDQWRLYFKSLELKKEKKVKKERKSLKQMLSQPKEKDEFEIEMENLAKNRRSYTKVTSINKSLFALPQPVVDILVQKLKIMKWLLYFCIAIKQVFMLYL